jgi:hypothetical protein
MSYPLEIPECQSSLQLNTCPAPQIRSLALNSTLFAVQHSIRRYESQVSNTRPAKLYNAVRVHIRKITYTVKLHGGCDSTVGIPTSYEVDGLGIEFRVGRDFPHPSGPALGPSHLPIQWVPGLFGLFAGGEVVGVWH